MIWLINQKRRFNGEDNNRQLLRRRKLSPSSLKFIDFCVRKWSFKDNVASVYTPHWMRTSHQIFHFSLSQPSLQAIECSIIEKEKWEGVTGVLKRGSCDGTALNTPGIRLRTPISGQAMPVRYPNTIIWRCLASDNFPASIHLHRMAGRNFFPLLDKSSAHKLLRCP